MIPLSRAALILLFLASSAWAQPAELPDPAVTPGECRPMTLQKVCNTKWGKDARAVTQLMKEGVFLSYHIPTNARHLPNGKAAYEIDHLCSRELAGADTIENLWPQPYTGPCNAHQKDRVENRLHKEVCAGHISLKAAQEMIKSDWRKAFAKYFGGSCEDVH